jgi:hypothetical protein
MGQPIIRGIQAVGAVDIKYQYNGPGGKLLINQDVMKLGDLTEVDTSTPVNAAGFRLDGEFLRAVQQIASSAQVPILGGGAVALTNNNRSGTLSINCTKVSTPDTDSGSMYRGSNNQFGPKGSDTAYDLVLLAQLQQAQAGGDSNGATLWVVFKFCGLYTTVAFEGCTVASVDPLGLNGNDAVNYNVSFNYTNWTCSFSTEAEDTSLTPSLAGDNS